MTAKAPHRYREITEFLEQRDNLVEQLGLVAFAELMSPFAAFERHLARAWSALIDESLEEVELSLTLAGRSLKEAQAFLPPTRSDEA